MPASTFEIIANNWEKENSVFRKIVTATKDAELYMTYYKGHLEVRIEPSSERSLVFEIRTAITLEWYLDKYPMAREEPEERIPYFFFNKSLRNEKHYSIAMANNYLDDLLIWKFSISYLSENPNHSIAINRETIFNSKTIPDTYELGWCFPRSV